jgi:hypothetical protein
MVWDGERQLSGVGGGFERARPRSRRRLRSLLSTGVVIAVLVGLLVPSMHVLAATGSAKQLLAAWSSVSRVDVLQESSSRIGYRGTWKTVPCQGTWVARRSLN